MGKAGTIYREVRFVIEEELTHCYVRMDATGDAPLGVQGWHHKAFGASKSIQDIVASFSTDSPVLWAQEAPDDDAQG